MDATPFVLAGLGVALAGPVPALLARAGWLRRTPLATMLLWQCVALAAVLSALGAGLSLATSHGWSTPSVLALVVTAVVAVRLGIAGHRVGTSLRTLRRHHREQLDLVTEQRGRLAVLATEQPLAYCVPSLRTSRVVVSQGALDRLSDDELSAVVAHERAHLRARHDLVLEAFSVLHRAFPRWVSSASALREVRILVEVLADKAAARDTGSAPLARALVGLAGAPSPSAGLSAAGSAPELVDRIDLLAAPPRPVQAVLVSLAAVGIVVLPTAFVVAPWLLGLA
ncbi:M56 family metallopeptidase [Nocardioides currus]|uniref:Zn-dependent protease with chaperone function n=1 Tax=Nocardioides currus TaxID=2133958 RepID=A0A2R7Z2Y0_9ACTN|nr:M56 family metallopeptidase [Nocardioides currus]PUA83003.1 Zn-dependent protease with chaperone function [Nocardioides currus]